MKKRTNISSHFTEFLIRLYLEAKIFARIGEFPQSLEHL